jgi:glycosyltransferase involved in cell wall biosynthesis
MNSIAYIANIRLPTEKAHGLQIMKTCEALAKSGVKIELLVPTRNDISNQEIFNFYNIQSVFKITKISLSYNKINSKIGFLLHSFIFSFKSVLYAKRNSIQAIYSRDKLPLFFAFLIGIPCYFESHMGGWGIFSIILKKINGIVCITNGLKDFYVSRGINSKKIIVAPDAVDLSLFTNLPNKEDCRKKLGLPLDKKIVMYVGSFGLYKWKGLDIFLESAKLFDQSFLFIAIGGTKDEIKTITSSGISSNVRLLERVNNSSIPNYLKSSDVLVIPNRSGDIISEKYTSPMKLFEYMASGVSIVASDLPSIREVIDDSNGILVEPDKAESLSEGIRLAISANNERSQKALEDVKNKYSWGKRVEIIKDFIVSSYEK